jgi:outer membrane protein assembly factor BamB
MRVSMLVLLVMAASAWGQGWQQFRGPGGGGVAGGVRIPDAFSPDKNVVWKMEAPAGKSSPVVAGRTIFLTGYEGEKLLTLGVDAASGRELWRRDVPRRRTLARNKLNDAAVPTPVTDGRNVYVFFSDFGFVAYNRNGKELWRKEVTLEGSMHGHASSPVLAGGVLILAADQERGSFLMGVDPATGRERWRTERPGSVAGAYTTPVPFVREKGGAQVVVGGDGEIVGYSTATGEKLWWVKGLPIQPKASPTVSGGTIYYAVPALFEGGLPQWAAVIRSDKDGDGKLSLAEAPGGPIRDNFRQIDTDGDGFWTEREWTEFYNMGTRKGYLLAIRPEGSGDVTEQATLWKADKGLPVVPTPVVHGGVVYMVRNGGVLTAVDAGTGAMGKQGRLTGAVGTYYASPVAAGDRVLAINVEGKAAVIRTGTEWELVGVNDMGEGCWATPALADGKLIIRTDRMLYAFAEGEQARRLH